MQLNQLIAKAVHDSEFRYRLILEPEAVLKELEIFLPLEQKVTVLENSEENLFFVLPLLSEEEITQLKQSIATVHPQRAARSRVVIQAHQDPAYRARLQQDPKSILKTEGINVPESLTITLLENSLQQLYIVLPHIHLAEQSHSH